MSNCKTNNKRLFGLLLKILAVIAMILLILCFVRTCQNCKQQQIRYIIVQRTGYMPDDEPWDSIPDEDPPYRDEDLDSLPNAVSLEHLFPPIGNQGNKGTCVAWAVGYNLTTALFAQKNKWTDAELSDKQNQTSPADLWFGIPVGSKTNACNGTNFESAFSVLTSKGAANMQSVPYSSIGNCRKAFSGDTSRMLSDYHQLVRNGQIPETKYIKAYINDSIPLAFGASLGDNFMNWSSDAVIKSDTRLNPGMMHANHAMVITGYDDGKHAFRVRNSWGAAWGDNGSIWIDYDYFTNDFCFAVFKAEIK